MMSHITIWENGTANSYTYTDLPEGHAQALIRLTESNNRFLIADASPDIGPTIHPRLRTSWYNRDLPPETSHTEHIHAFKTVASWPDGPEHTATLRRCSCGEEIHATIRKT